MFAQLGRHRLGAALRQNVVRLRIALLVGEAGHADLLDVVVFRELGGFGDLLAVVLPDLHTAGLERHDDGRKLAGRQTAAAVPLRRCRLGADAQRNQTGTASDAKHAEPNASQDRHFHSPRPRPTGLVGFTTGAIITGNTTGRAAWQ